MAAVVSLLREGADDRLTKVAGRLERAIPDLVAYQEVLATQMAPWDCSTIPRTVDSPRPVPRPGALVVKNGSKMRAMVSSLIPEPVSRTEISV